MASELHVFFAADRDWCEERVLPLLDWAHPSAGTANLGGFLSWGRWNDQLLAAGFLTQYLATAAHIGEFPDEFRRQLGGPLRHSRKSPSCP